MWSNVCVLTFNTISLIGLSYNYILTCPIGVTSVIMQGGTCEHTRTKVSLFTQI